MPPAIEYLYNWFSRLSNRRGGGFGPAPLSFTELDNFFRLIGIEPQPWEVETLEALDNLWLKTSAEDEKKKLKKDKEDGKRPGKT